VIPARGSFLTGATQEVLTSPGTAWRVSRENATHGWEDDAVSTDGPSEGTPRDEGAGKVTDSAQTAGQRAEAYEAQGLPGLAALVRCSGDPDGKTGAAAASVEARRERREQRGETLDALNNVIFHGGDPTPLAVLLRRHMTPERRAQLTRLLAAPARPEIRM